ncbi:MAG: aminoacyl-tRNA hydrolase [Desulfobacterales bacterium]|jgi:PTH1 family peptidyl-tRNA hydrolase|nr:aminoacyl-tRNA hydrolase [Desulfobacterales bacterium]
MDAHQNGPGGRLRLVVGLGNPGPHYSATRHNIGFRVVERLAEEFAVDIGRQKFDAVFGRGRIGPVEAVLAKPLAFMNRSGPPVRQLADFFKISSQDILVVHDDIDLTFGRIKIKEKGGHGGHNGLRSVIDAFGGGAFTRLRLGIGRSGTGQDAAGYVLDRFGRDEAAMLPQLIQRARDAVVTILVQGAKAGMNQFNVNPATLNASHS